MKKLLILLCAGFGLLCGACDSGEYLLGDEVWQEINIQIASGANFDSATIPATLQSGMWGGDKYYFEKIGETYEYLGIKGGDMGSAVYFHNNGVAEYFAHPIPPAKWPHVFETWGYDSTTRVLGCSPFTRLNGSAVVVSATSDRIIAQDDISAFGSDNMRVYYVLTKLTADEENYWLSHEDYQDHW